MTFGEFCRDSAEKTKFSLHLLLQNLEIWKKVLIFAASEHKFWLSGQNPERARLYRHYPFKRVSSEALLVLAEISFHEHFDVGITLNKATGYG